MRRNDAEGDDEPTLGETAGAFDRGVKGFQIGDHVIGGHHQQQRIVLIALQGERDGRQGRRGVAAAGLENDAPHRAVNRLQLVEDQKTMLLVA